MPFFPAGTSCGAQAISFIGSCSRAACSNSCAFVKMCSCRNAHVELHSFLRASCSEIELEGFRQVFAPRGRRRNGRALCFGSYEFQFDSNLTVLRFLRLFIGFGMRRHLVAALAQRTVSQSLFQRYDSQSNFFGLLVKCFGDHVRMLRFPMC